MQLLDFFPTLCILDKKNKVHVQKASESASLQLLGLEKEREYERQED